MRPQAAQPASHAGRPGRAEPIGCILSDCDGVIVDSEVIAETVMVQTLQQAFGVADLTPHLADMFGQRVIDIIRGIEQRLHRPQDEARRNSLQQAIDARVAELAPAMPDTLATYRALGLPVAVVSNSAFHRLHRCVERAGLLPLVGEHLYSAELVGRPKPAPDAYLYAARKMGFAPAACLVIEDSPTGVLAACAAGMRVVGFLGGSHIGSRHPAQLEVAGAQVLLDRMTDLPALIARMNLAACA